LNDKRRIEGRRERRLKEKKRLRKRDVKMKGKGKEWRTW